MEILEKMFGGAGRVKIMRLFLYNPTTTYSREDVSDRSRVSFKSVLSELSHFEKMELIKRKFFFKEEIVTDKNGTEKIIRNKMQGWELNAEFPYLLPLQGLLINPDMIKHDSILKKITSAGKIRLLILSGIFIQDPTSRVDLLIVGDRLKRGTLENILKNIEAEIGKELRYAVFETDDYKYRLSVYDKLLHDILDYPHEKILDRIGLK